MPVIAQRKAVALCALVAATAIGLPVSSSAAGIAPAQPPQQSCPNAIAPPPPVDTSEVPKPGVPEPTPLEVPPTPVGGDRLGSCDVITPSGAPALPTEVSSDTWVLADLDSGQVLAAKDPHGRHRPASTIKLLTGLLVTRELKMDDTLVATQEDANQEGSRAGIVPNATYTVRQVLSGLFMQSGNDCAHALAMKLGGVEQAVAKINGLAHELGALDTRVATPSGLDGPGMSTSSFDLALVLRTGMHNPDFAAALGTKHLEIPGAPGQPPVPLNSDNPVLMHYPGALGGKTGFTDDARHTFAAVAERNGKRLLTVLMHGENKPIRQAAQATELLDYGFALTNPQSVGALEHKTPAAKPPAPVLAQGPPPGNPQQSGWFGSVGGPLTLIAAVAVILFAVVTLRARRAKFAAASRRDAEDANTHP